ncbi:layilin-like [Saccoglossus kowalevskii]
MKMMFITLLALTLMCLSPVQGIDSPFGSTTSCTCYEYKIYCRTSNSDWDWAKDECERQGGWLATIDKQTTHQQIRTIIRNTEGAETRACHDYGFWIGLYDPRPLPKPSSHKNHPEMFTWVHDQCEEFEVWEENQPNDNISESSDGQNCVQLWYRTGHIGNYDDEYCYEKKGYVCQFETDCQCAAE